MTNLKESYKKELKEKRFKVSLFGSARLKEDDVHYKEVYNLAKKIGERGIDLVTGGGPGVMKAASAGHHEGSKKTGAHTIGLSIKLPHKQKTNEYINVEKKFTRFSQRLDNFMMLSNAVIVAPGGIGTTLELFYAWQLMQVKQICNIPIILLGHHWKGLINWLEEQPLKRGFIKKEDLNLLFVAKNHKEAMKMIEEAYTEYKKGTKNYCLNYKKYKLY